MWPNLERISWGHIDGVRAEKGPPGVGIIPSTKGPGQGSAASKSGISSSSDIAVSTFV